MVQYYTRSILACKYFKHLSTYHKLIVMGRQEGILNHFENLKTECYFSLLSEKYNCFNN